MNWDFSLALSPHLVEELFEVFAQYFCQFFDDGFIFCPFNTLDHGICCFEIGDARNAIGVKNLRKLLIDKKVAGYFLLILWVIPVKELKYMLQVGA